MPSFKLGQDPRRFHIKNGYGRNCASTSLIFLLSFVSGLAFADVASVRELSDLSVTATAEDDNDVRLGASSQILRPDDFPTTVTKLSDALSYVSGVYQAGAGSDLGKKISIRGFNSNQIKIYLDGVPVGSPNDQSFKLDGVSLAQVEKIVVQKGAYTVGAGSSMGGVIWITTKKNIKHNDITASYSNYNTYDVVSNLAHNNKNLKLNFSARHYSTKGNYKFKNPRSSGLYDNDQPEYLTMKNNEKRIQNVQVGAHSLKHNTSLGIRVEKKKTNITGPTTIFYNDVHEEEQSIGMNIANSYQRPLAIIDTLKTKLSLKDEKRNYFDLLGERMGIPEQTQFKNRHIGLKSEAIKAWNPSVYSSTSIHLDRIGNEDQASQKRMRSSTGLVHYSEFSLFNDYLSLIPSISVFDYTDHGTLTNGGVNILARPAQSIELGFSVQSGYRLPNFLELYQEQGLIIGNPNLKREQTKGIELSASYSDKVKLSYYYYETKNLIDYQLISGFRYRPSNTQKALTEGLELSVNEKSKYFSFQTALSAQNVLNKSDDPTYHNQKVPGKPSFFGATTLTVNLWSDTFISWSNNFALDRYHNRANTIKLNDRIVHDASINKKLRDIGTLTFSVQNIFDKDQIDSRGYPLMGRTYHAKATYQF